MRIDELKRIKRRWQRVFSKSGLKNPVFYWPFSAGTLFLLLVLASALLVPYQSSPASLALQGGLNRLFLDQTSPVPLVSLPLNFIGGGSVKAITVTHLPATEVLGALTTPFSPGAENEISEYIVEPGDNLSGIAAQFDISLNTLIWANDIVDPSRLSPGDKLIILPVSGLLHYVKKGESISYLAQLYEVKTSEIISFNELSSEGEIFIGDLLIIPGGKMPSRRVVASAPSAPLADNLFICPIGTPCRVSQGLHWYNAIDFSNNKCSEPIFAVAGGQVQKTGYGRVAGNFIRLLHGSGIVTFYGHLSKILVRPGQSVLQGQLIGYTGYSGYTIPAGPAGCHVHFEVRGARNPFAG